jgi:hypothetical protein
MNVDALIDQFVAKANLCWVKAGWADEIPEGLRVGDLDSAGESPWQIKPVIGTPWIATLESRLPMRLPASYRSLVTRYVFAPFTAGPVQLHGNTGLERAEDLSQAIFRDAGLAKVVLAAGFLPFAWPADGHYDPVCFDANQLAPDGEMPIVRLDHEAALLRNRARVMEVIAPSFFTLVSGLVQRRCA